MSLTTADGIPNEEGFFRGLAQAPLHFHNAVAELLDNAIAVKEEGFEIKVDISKVEADTYEVTISDNGPGMSFKDIQDRIFKTGQPPLPHSSPLSEHGFGLKNVLAKVQAEGGNWSIRTRDTDTFRRGEFYKMRSPLKYKMHIAVLQSTDWPEFGAEGAGTIICLKVPLSFMQTVGWGRRGRPPSTPTRILEYLREHLGVFYRGYLGLPYIGYKGTTKGKGKIITSLNWNSVQNVKPIEPDFDYRKHIKRIDISTPHGTIRIEGEYGLLSTSSEVTRKTRHYYYRNTTESQGVDIRMGGRVMATRLLTEIWEKARHPSYNAFWGEFRIPAVRNQVPRTLNNKTSIDFSDDVWIAIADGVKSQILSPLKTKSDEKDEDQVRTELFEKIKSTKIEHEIVEKEYSCWGGSGVVIDIYRQVGSEIIVYEAKLGKAHPLDVYQLRLYWDGLVEDGKQPTHGYLVAQEKTTGVSTILNALNHYKDKNGKHYRMGFKTWTEFDID